MPPRAGVFALAAAAGLTLLALRRRRRRDATARVPRRVYSQSPTPIEAMPRLSERVCAGVAVSVKRDDLLPLAGGGSKTRKLEFLMQEAADAGADVIVTCGAVQSNHCRLTASAAAMEGLRCVLILEERVPGSYAADAGGNNYAFELLGAETIVVADGGIPDAQAALVARLTADGCRPYVIPGGGSNPLGSLGYVRCAEEILGWRGGARAHGFDAIVACSGSGGTHAGLVAGLRAAGDATPVHGISVRFEAKKQHARILPLARGTCAKLLEASGACADAARAEARAEELISADDIIIHDEYVGPGYSKYTPAMAEAVAAFARHEGILLDPVYTGKGAAGLIDLCRRGAFAPGAKVLFLHTGGAPSLFHYKPLEQG